MDRESGDDDAFLLVTVVEVLASWSKSEETASATVERGALLVLLQRDRAGERQESSVLVLEGKVRGSMRIDVQAWMGEGVKVPQ
jgi:hypothetical protein